MSRREALPDGTIRTTLSLTPGTVEAMRIVRIHLEASSDTEVVRRMAKMSAALVQDSTLYHKTEAEVFVPVKFLFL